MKRLLLLSLGVILISCEKNDPLSDLIDVYEEALTDTEKNLFNYVSDEYFLFNPGTDSGTFKSYVGVYFNDSGDST